MSSFQTYLLGFIILVVGLAVAAYLLSVPPLWIAVGALVLIGIGVITATNNTKPRDPQKPPTY
jgi:positive regulator of sigma E activity